ncbi:hypothetical protein MMC25_000554 [Agyrium rufum]|nr:hypothetical protein [Agyrium rufum]
MMQRIFLTLINIFFPPLTVCLLAGPSTDCLINCLLFIAGVIPSHVHGFYISCTYFHRRKKVRKGRWPGPWKSFIYSEKVQVGGATREQVKVLKWEMEEEKRRKAEKRGTGSWRSFGSRGGGGGKAMTGTGSVRREGSLGRTTSVRREGSLRRDGSVGRAASARRSYA